MTSRSAVLLGLEYVILGLIRRQPSHGYGLLQQWQDKSGLNLIWRIKPGVLYAGLGKLEQKGFVNSLVVPGIATPPRNENCITPLGEAAFLQWMETPVASMRDMRQDFLSKLYFEHDVSQALVEGMLQQQIIVSHKWKLSMEQQLINSSGFERQVLVFRIQQVQGVLDWLKNLAHKTIFSSSGG